MPPTYTLYRRGSVWCITCEGQIVATFRDAVEAVVWGLAIAERGGGKLIYIGVSLIDVKIGREEYAARKEAGTAPLPLGWHVH